MILLFSNNTMAAVKNQSFDEKLILNLENPHKQAVQQLKGSGASVERLKVISFDESLPMNTRWKSFMVLTEIQGLKSLNEIKKALTSKTWYMRSAGLTALDKLDKQAAKQWAYTKLGQDPALMVRMKALELLQDNTEEKVIELFWSKLNSKDSFHQDKALWIREDLAQSLLKNPRKKDLLRWVQLLYDKEANFQKIASLALARLNSQAESGGQDLSYWQKKYPLTEKL